MTYTLKSIDNARIALVEAANLAEERADFYKHIKCQASRTQALQEASRLCFAAFSYLGTDGDHWSRRK